MKTTKKTSEAEVISGIAENWKSQSKQLKAKFPQLTDSDLKFETEEEDELLGRIETRLKKNREEVINILEKIQKEESSVKA
jgi:hypothetical protein